MKRVLFVVPVVLLLIVWLWALHDLDKHYDQPSVKVEPVAPPSYIAALNSLAANIKDVRKEMDSTTVILQFNRDADIWKTDCIRQTPEEWDRLKCEARRKKLLKRYKEMGEVRP